MVERCPRCELKFEKDEGSRLGSAMLNYGAVGIALVVYLIVAFVMTIPNVPVVPVMLGAVLVVLLVAVIGFPFAKTLWSAIELVSKTSDGD
jgi:hypothetical protein